MDYNRQVEEISNYFKINEKNKKDFKIGVEFEHFVIDKKTLKSISYYGENGVMESIKELLKFGWKGKYEGDNLLGLEKEGTTITLEPGSQFEISIRPHKDIQDIEEEYKTFLNEIIPILDGKNQGLIALGYHPESKISDIKMIPKERYKYMYEYFKSRGSHAHNMMKGTASMQLTVDFSSEEDYIKKFKIANGLSPVIYAIFDNSPYYEGNLCDKEAIRTYIWQNCDSDRCGIVENALEESFNYNRYAEYILNRAPIFVMEDEKIVFTKDKLNKDIFDPNNYTKEELEHILTMFFPDVRTKKFIEIRMSDSIPYPLNFSGVALWKGLMYCEKNLDLLYEFVKDIRIDDINLAKEEIINKGLNAKFMNKSILEIGKWLVDISKEGLEEDEKAYLKPLEEILNSKLTPSGKTKSKLGLGKREALDWCILKNNRGE